ncbi:MAG: hypothetical protein MAG471_00293 [Acidimicrobiaceae bacterium]|nr:hypothetical protein [Acidimicrobiaceae bacterium]
MLEAGGVGEHEHAVGSAVTVDVGEAPAAFVYGVVVR